MIERAKEEKSESATMSGKRGRLRPRPVSFGNPALGTYGGCVYMLEEDESCPPVSTVLAGAVDKTVAMADVPSEQVPEGFLNLARSYPPLIKHPYHCLIHTNTNKAPR